MREWTSISWNMPVLHDTIMAAVMSVRYTTSYMSWGKKVYEMHNSKEIADKAFNILKRMVDMGADTTKRGSYGTSCIYRALLDASYILPENDPSYQTIEDEKEFTDEVKEDLVRIFNLLFEHGADINETLKIHEKSIKEFYDPQPVGLFFP